LVEKDVEGERPAQGRERIGGVEASALPAQDGEEFAAAEAVREGGGVRREADCLRPRRAVGGPVGAVDQDRASPAPAA
jgi:hypothetical protein